MKSIYRRRWFRILPLFVLVVALFAGILYAVIPSSSAAGTGFLAYHDSYYGYSVTYPKDWKITHGSSHTSLFVAPGNNATCQVDIQVTWKALIPHSALMGALPQKAYSISHNTVNGFPALAFSEYSDNVQEPNGTFASASTQMVIVAPTDPAHGTNLYTLSLNMFRAAFMRTKNAEPHTACESNFKVMANSLMPATNSQGSIGDTRTYDDTSNPAIQYADYTWDWNNFDNSPNLFCGTGYYPVNGPPPYHCDDGTSNSQKTPPAAGYYQPYFECAEFVSRALAAEGYIPGLDPYTSPQNSYDAYPNYHLTYVGTPGTPGLFDYLKSIGAVDVTSDPSQALPGDVVFYYTDKGDASREHVSLIVDKTPDGQLYVDAHNRNTLHQEYTLGGSNSGFDHLVILHLPPPNIDSPGVTLYALPNYNANASAYSFKITQAGSYSLPSAFASSIAIQPGWGVVAFDGNLQKVLVESVANLQYVTFPNSSQTLNKAITSVYVSNNLTCSAATTKKVLHTTSVSCNPSPCPSSAAFITDVTYPDGAPLPLGNLSTKHGSCRIPAVTAHGAALR